MADPFVGEIRLVGFNYSPVNWEIAAGQTKLISQFTMLFSLITNTYGGDGRTNFQLPNLQGRIPIGSGQGPGLSQYKIGNADGSATVTLNGSQMPSHTHSLAGDGSEPQGTDPANAKFGLSPAGSNVYYSGSARPMLTPMNPQSLTPSQGGSGAHNNIMPSLAMNWIIAMTGIFPMR